MWNKYGHIIMSEVHHGCKIKGEHIVGLGPLTIYCRTHDRSCVNQLRKLGFRCIGGRLYWDDIRYDNPKTFYEFVCNYTYLTRNFIFEHYIKPALHRGKTSNELEHKYLRWAEDSRERNIKSRLLKFKE